MLNRSLVAYAEILEAIHTIPTESKIARAGIIGDFLAVRELCLNGRDSITYSKCTKWVRATNDLQETIDSAASELIKRFGSIPDTLRVVDHFLDLVRMRITDLQGTIKSVEAEFAKKLSIFLPPAYERILEMYRDYVKDSQSPINNQQLAADLDWLSRELDNLLQPINDWNPYHYVIILTSYGAYRGQGMGIDAVAQSLFGYRPDRIGLDQECLDISRRLKQISTTIDSLAKAQKESDRDLLRSYINDLYINVYYLNSMNDPEFWDYPVLQIRAN